MRFQTPRLFAPWLLQVVRIILRPHCDPLWTFSSNCKCNIRDEGCVTPFVLGNWQAVQPNPRVIVHRSKMEENSISARCLLRRQIEVALISARTMKAGVP